MHVQERKLEDPEDDEADHRVCRDALVCGDMVGEFEKGGPDGAEHDAHRVGAVHGLDGEPEYCKDCAADDGNVGAPEAPAGAGEDGEGGMIHYSRRTWDGQKD